MQQFSLGLDIVNWVYSRGQHYLYDKDEFEIRRGIRLGCTIKTDVDWQFYVNGSAYRSAVNIHIRVQAPMRLEKPVHAKVVLSQCEFRQILGSIRHYPQGRDDRRPSPEFMDGNLLVSDEVFSEIFLHRDELHHLRIPLIYQTGPKTSAKRGCSCSIWEKRCISGPSQSSRMVGSRS